MAEVADPDIMAPVRGVLGGDGCEHALQHQVEASWARDASAPCRRRHGELPCDIAVIGTHKLPNTTLAAAPGSRSAPPAASSSTRGMATPARTYSLRATVSRSRTASLASRSRDCPEATPTRKARSPAPTPRAVIGRYDARLRAVGDGGRQVDDRRGVLRRDPRHSARASRTCRRGRGHLPGALLPGGTQDSGEAARRARRHCG